MGKLTGKEGKRYSKQDRNDAVQNEANEFSHEPHYTRHVIFGKEFLEDLLDEDGAVGIKFEFTKNQDGKRSLIATPVDAQGNDLDDEDDDKKIHRGKPIKTYDDPPHCPPQC